MSIRTKITILLGVSFFLLMTTLMITSRIFVIGGFAELESQDVHINIERVLSEITNTLSHLVATTGDWAPWDDTYKYIQDQNEEYVNSNLPPVTLVNLNINFMLFVDSAGTLVNGLFVDLHTVNEKPIPHELWEGIRSKKKLLMHHLPEGSINGIIVINRQPVFIVSRPILKSDFSGPIRGALIVGRYVDENEIHRLSQITHLPIEAFATTDKQLPSDVKSLKSSFKKDDPIIIKIENDDFISGYSLLTDIEGNPGIIIKVLFPRKIFKHGHLTLNYCLFSFLAIGLVFFVLVMFFLEKVILLPLGWLSNKVNDINPNDSNLKCISLHREDELGQLTKALNGLLEQVNKKTNALIKVNKELEDDISNRVKTEIALRESEEKFRLISEQSLLAILITQNGSIKYVNKALSKIIGYPVEDILEWKRDEYSKIIYSEDKDYVMSQSRKKQNAESDIVINYKFRMVTKTNKVKWAALYSKTVIYEGQPAVLTTIIDISDNVEAKEEKEKLQRRLQRAQKMEAIGTLAGGVAHDLNNVLSGIVSYPDLILMQLPEKSPLIKSIMTIKQSGYKASAIVQDLLTLARRGVSVKETVNLNSLILDYIQSPEYKKLKSFYPDVSEQVDLHQTLLNIMGSPVHLSKTIMNLISNAVEAMPDGGNLVISTENRYIDKPLKGYDDFQEGEYAVISVSDTGVGISAIEKDRIFEPFYTKKVMGRSGTGLGMAVVWGSVKDHHGHIEIESTVGKGTTFIIYFPATRKPLAGTKGHASIELYRGEGESILVVDDVESQREIASALLSQLGYTVTAVSSGSEAVAFLNNHTVDLLILDMIMDPGIDGLETYRKVLEIHPDQKAIIASGFSETERVEEAQRLGAGQYIKKPYTLENIGIAVKIELEK